MRSEASFIWISPRYIRMESVLKMFGLNIYGIRPISIWINSWVNLWARKCNLALVSLALSMHIISCFISIMSLLYVDYLTLYTWPGIEPDLSSYLLTTVPIAYELIVVIRGKSQLYYHIEPDMTLPTSPSKPNLVLQLLLSPISVSAGCQKHCSSNPVLQLNRWCLPNQSSHRHTPNLYFISLWVRRKKTRGEFNLYMFFSS